MLRGQALKEHKQGWRQTFDFRRLMVAIESACTNMLSRRDRMCLNRFRVYGWIGRNDWKTLRMDEDFLKRRKRAINNGWSLSLNLIISYIQHVSKLCIKLWILFVVFRYSGKLAAYIECVVYMLDF